MENEFTLITIFILALSFYINLCYKKNQYREICYGYAKEFQCIEFHPLIKNYELQK